MRKNKKEKVKPLLTDEEIKKRKAKKLRLSLSCFILLLAVGVMGNWYWENSDISTKLSSISTSSEKILGEATFVDATTQTTTQSSESTYFSNARVDRENSRDESIEKLQKILDSVDESEEAHKDAADKITQLSDNITAENKIESLVTAKGIENCIAVINEDGTKVDVIVDCEELTDTIILQIKEIAVNQTGCTYDNVTIIQSK